MTLPGVADQVVYRLRGTKVTDAWDNSTTDWSPGATQRKRIDGCVFQPVAGDEFNQGRDAITTRWDWTGPPTADVKSDDRIEYKGIAYEVDGSVTAPEGLGLDHKHAVCKRVEG